MAKAPVPGQVKTRLGAGVGAAEAARLYALFIQDVAEEMNRLVAPTPGPDSCLTVALAYTPVGSEAAFKALLPMGMPLFAQLDGDLGQRLNLIFNTCFAQGYDQVHVVGSDSPDLPSGRVTEAIRRLCRPATDVVLGPCRDGGYYLIGLKQPAPALFQKIPWSTGRVLATTLQCARQLNLTAALLDPWDDIDTPEDLAGFFNRNRHRAEGRHAPGRRTLNDLQKRSVPRR